MGKISDRRYTLSQHFLTENILKDNEDLTTTLSANAPLMVGTVLQTDTEVAPIDQGRFLSVIGSLSYLAVGTRPDLAYSVNFLARYASTPQKEHWNALKHLLRFLKNTAGHVLTVHPTGQLFQKPIETFVDANWGGEFARSTYGHVTRLFGVPVAWVSKRQTCVATSTCHAEYMAIGAACRDSVWLHSLISDILPRIERPLLLGDNTSLVHVSTDNTSNKRTRHTDREFYYINEQLHKKRVDLIWIPTAEQLGDVFTKILGPLKFRKAQDDLGVR